jgi:response regulator RpfG family c-di-GMP phosphodiesterase
MHPRRPSILLVSAEPRATSVFAEWLWEAGYSCLTARDITSALRLTRQSGPHVVLIDADSLSQDAIRLARFIAAGATSPAIMFVSSAKRVRVASPAASACIAIPTSREELLDGIAKAIDKRDAAEAQALSAHLATMTTVELRHEMLRGALAGVQTPSAASVALTAPFGDRLPPLFGHARRVARSAVMLAKALHLPSKVVGQIEGAALLHDIGKLALPEPVLFGDAPVGEAEMEALLDHHARTLDLLGDAPVFAPIRHLVECVHECWDGQGYPNGLAEESIPLGARIVAVADAHDAARMWSLHDEPQSRDDSQRTLVREAGTRLDPNLVRVFLHAVETQPCS